MCESKELVVTPKINTTSTGPGPSACEADVMPIHDEPSWNKPCSVNSSHHDDDNEHSSCQLLAHTAQNTVRGQHNAPLSRSWRFQQPSRVNKKTATPTKVRESRSLSNNIVHLCTCSDSSHVTSCDFLTDMRCSQTVK